jgi:hypothetical protein
VDNSITHNNDNNLYNVYNYGRANNNYYKYQYFN